MTALTHPCANAAVLAWCKANGVKVEYSEVAARRLAQGAFDFGEVPA